jgi:putative IMPACT (imprinted ancient) family translation regulator
VKQWKNPLQFYIIVIKVIYKEESESLLEQINKESKKNSHRTTKFEIAANSLKESACFFFIL